VLKEVLFSAAMVASGVLHAAEPAITLSVTVKAPVSAVWKAWTSSSGLTSFFAPEAEVDVRPDGAFHIYMDPYGKPGMKGADTMQLLAVEPEQLLSFTWNAPPIYPRHGRSARW